MVLTPVGSTTTSVQVEFPLGTVTVVQLPVLRIVLPSELVELTRTWNVNALVVFWMRRTREAHQRGSGRCC
jgi:hypothetical protein